MFGQLYVCKHGCMYIWWYCILWVIVIIVCGFAYCGRVFYWWYCFVSMVNGCTIIEDIVFVGLMVVQIAREDLRDKRSLRGALSREIISRATQWVPLYPYGFSGNFGRVVSPTQPSGWTI